MSNRRSVPLLLVALLVFAGAAFWLTSGDGSSEVSAAGAAANHEEKSKAVAAPAPLAGAPKKLAERVSVATTKPAEDLAQAAPQAVAEATVHVTGRVLCRDVEAAQLRVRLAWLKTTGHPEQDPTAAQAASTRLEQHGDDLDWPKERHWIREPALPLATTSAYTLVPQPGAATHFAWRVEVWWSDGSNEAEDSGQHSLPLAHSLPFFMPAAGEQAMEDLVADLPVIVKARADATSLQGSSETRLTWSLVLHEAPGDAARNWRRRKHASTAAGENEVTLLLPPNEAGKWARVLAQVGMLKAPSREQYLRLGVNDFGTVLLPAQAWIRGQVMDVQRHTPVAAHPVNLLFVPDQEKTAWSADEVSTGAKSDENGRFTFGPLSAGRYIVSAYQTPGERVGGLKGNAVSEELRLLEGDAREMVLRIGKELSTLTVKLEGLPPGTRCSVSAWPEGGTDDEMALESGNPVVFQVDPTRRTLIRSVAGWGRGAEAQIFFAGEWGPSPEREATLAIPVHPTRIELLVPAHGEDALVILAPRGTLPRTFPSDDMSVWMGIHYTIVDASETSTTLIGLPPGAYTVRMRPMSGTDTWDPADPSVHEWTVEVR